MILLLKKKLFKDYDLGGVDKEMKVNIYKLNIDIFLFWCFFIFNSFF